MDKSNASRLSRRSAIATAGAAALAALTKAPASAVEIEPSAPRFTDSIPTAWAAWKGYGARDLGGLLGNMVTETTTATWWPILEREQTLELNWLTRFGLHRLIGELENVHVRMLAAQQDTALALGFALAMTRDRAPYGPESWYQAALAYSGITVMPPEEHRAAYARLDEATVENARLHGYVLRDDVTHNNEGKDA